MTKTRRAYGNTTRLALAYMSLAMAKRKRWVLIRDHHPRGDRNLADTVRDFAARLELDFDVKTDSNGWCYVRSNYLGLTVDEKTGEIKYDTETLE